MSTGRERGWYHSSIVRPDRQWSGRDRHTSDVTAIIGGLVAAMLWATATLCSSRTSRVLGTRVVLAWVMIIGAIVGLPLAAVSPLPPDVPVASVGLLLVAGVCYGVGLGLAYAALSIGKVAIVAPIVSTEGAVAAMLAIILGSTVGLASGITLAVVAAGVVLSSMDRRTSDVPAGDIDIVADAIDGPAGSVPAVTGADTTPTTAAASRRSIGLAIAAAGVFGLGLLTTGYAAQVLPAAWVAWVARLVGVVIIAAPVVARGQLRMTRATAPLLVVAGVGEILGSTASAWGAQESIPIVAVMGSQFAAIAAIAAFFLFGERLARIQLVGVVLIAVGVTVLAALQA